jgi:syntaxin 16
VLFAADEDRRGLLSGGAYHDTVDDGDAVIEMDLLPPRWADVSDEVTELLGEVARKSQALDRLHQKHVLPGFNDDDTKKAEEGEIEKLTRDITRAFQECRKCIQRVEQMVREGKSQGTMSRAEEVMAQNIQSSLASRIQEASAGFRKKQSTYLKSEFKKVLLNQSACRNTDRCNRTEGTGWPCWLPHTRQQSIDARWE